MSRRELYLTVAGACVGALLVVAIMRGATALAVASFLIGSVLGLFWRSKG